LPKKIGPFDKKKASEVANAIKGMRWKDQYEKVRTEIDARIKEVFDSLPKIVPVVESDLVTLRVASLQTILDSFKKMWGQVLVTI